MNFSEEYLEDYYDMFIQTDQSEQLIQSIRVVSIVIYSMTCVLGIPGNSFVIWIAGVKMKRTVNTVWFVNLAVADLLCCISIPFSLVEIILNQHWPFGEAMCKVIPSVMYLNMFASVFTLVLISLDRFVLIILPVLAQNHRSITLAWLLCGLAWVLALLLSLPTMIHNGTIDSVDNDEIIMCTSVHPLGENNIRGFFSAIKATHVPRLVLGFLVPLTVIAVCYLLIGRRVSSAHFKSQRTFWLILAVVAAFFVCWLPYHTIGMVIGYGRFASAGEAWNWYPLAISLAYVNSCLNPVLYVFMGQDFKERVRVSFRKIFENVFSEDAITHTSVTHV
ncbi:C3a anaphylatoxin chemotactic receptor-like [Oncorhynchus tshawytscha]|uniref:G-protein coupled receptors family 1 profile domain-containing protein n=1 Tax=Oncorhynchus tshawytscha TaxID=74940 RepID=A0A8C8HWG9_ONCTS|nr:C3a anaphylatoxin chemotactic receptor-like [Oncorhynchus tshawytscha]